MARVPIGQPPAAAGAASRRRWLMLAPAILLSGHARSASSPAGSRLEALGAGARLVLPLTGKAGSGRVFGLDGPPRLVLDLTGYGVEASAVGTAAGVSPVERLRHGLYRPGVTRVVLDLDRPVVVRRATFDRTAQGISLVVELAPGSASAFRALAGGRAIASPQTGVASGGAPSRVGPGSPSKLGSAEAKAPAPPQRPLVVVIDPGHGGKDPGAIGVSGTHEKRITLATAFELRKRLQARPGLTVHLTRSADVFVPLAERVRFAQARDADLFVSLHADSAPQPIVRGASVYTLAFEASDELAAALASRENAADQVAQPSFPGVSPEVARILFSLVRRETLNDSAILAGTLVERLGRASPLLAHPHRQAGFVVLKAPDVPSVLVELGFLSNRQDERSLRDASHRARLADALAEALVEHGATLDRPTAVAGAR